jgi:hypothetical protein
MNKITYLQAGIIAVLTLTIGVLMGLFLDFPKTKTDELVGSIGKVDRFRNVQITEGDILLRNELVSDTAKRKQYEKYLLYYYYQSLKTSTDVDQVIKKAPSVKEFNDVYYPYAAALNNFKDYLESARADILNALNLVLLLDKNENAPIIHALNLAQNAISRIKNHDAVLLNYLNAMESFIGAHPDQSYPELVDAHDILTLNMMQSAILTQNKPMLTYFEKKKLLNQKEGINELVAEAQFKSFFEDRFALDAQMIGVLDTEQLKYSVSVVEQLNTIIWTDMSELNDLEELQSVILLNNDKLKSVVGSADFLGIEFPIII